MVYVNDRETLESLEVSSQHPKIWIFLQLLPNNWNTTVSKCSSSKLWRASCFMRFLKCEVSVWGQIWHKVTSLLHSSLLPPLLTFINIIVSSENSVTLMRLHYDRFYPILQTQPFLKRAFNLDEYKILKSRKQSNVAPVSQGDDRTCMRSRLSFVKKPEWNRSELPGSMWLIEVFIFFFFQWRSTGMDAESQLPEEIIAESFLNFKTNPILVLNNG